MVDTFQASGFALHDQPNDACLELNKQLDNLQIQIKFQYKNPSAEMEEDQ